MATTAARLYAGAGLSAAANTVRYTVPGATTAILKHLALCNSSANQVAVSCRVGAVAILSGYAVPANGVLLLDLALVATTGQTVELWAATAGVIDATLSGVVVS